LPDILNLENVHMRTLSAFVASLLLTSSAVFAQATAAPAAPASVPAKAQDPTVPSIKYDKDGTTPNPSFMKNHEKFVEQAKKGGIDVLFLGDSITAGWAGNGKEIWAERYAPMNAANFGIGGDRTQHVLWRIENGELDGAIKPKVIVLMIGTNNTGGSDTAEQIAEGVTKIVKTAQAKTGANVLLLGVFPRGITAKQAEESKDPKKIEAAKRTPMQREKITKINEIISKLDDGKTVRYLDIKDKFLSPEGTLSPDIMPDYLHLTPPGYKIWADAIDPLLKEMMGS
jgi:lysophospholipase L1-like esterase